MGTIRVSNLGKTYRLYPNRWARLLEWVGFSKKHKEKWVLQGLNFEISAGESVGIIGVNGAGKSTLLKLIAGISQPTTGNINLEGKVSALLELGTGFHPDFTGIQNIFMAAQLQGLSTEQIETLLPQIESFAELGDYIHQPLRIYSSGMQLRLAFSVATAVRPDILIVDEALAVGDTNFQHKCTERIREFRDQGTTLLLVSHSPSAITAICNRALMLADGEIKHDGPPDEVMDHYNALIARKNSQYILNLQRNCSGQLSTISGSQEATISHIDLFADGKSSRFIESNATVDFQIDVQINADIQSLCAGLLIRDKWGNDVWGTNTHYHDLIQSILSEGEVLKFNFQIPNLFLNPGSYSVSVALHADESHLSKNYEWRDRALVFEVAQIGATKSIGVCNLPVRVAVSKLCDQVG